jgi:hypothetical protein
MKICICICLSEKNKHFSIKSIKSLNKIIIPSNYEVEFAFVIQKNFYYFKKKISKLVLLNKKNFFLTTSKNGIPYARNTFLKFIKKKKYIYLGFLDDDCIIDKFWLVNMIKVMDSNNPDIITGPQLHNVRNNKINEYFKIIEPKYDDNQKIKWAATNNVFFKKKILDNNKVKFDIRLNNIGGSDQLFFSNLWQKGCKIIWNKKSKVIEGSHLERNNLYWFLIRNFRYGFSGYYIDKYLKVNTNRFIFNLGKILYLFVQTIFNLIFIIKKNNFVISLFYFFRLIGRLYAILGFKVKKYY